MLFFAVPTARHCRQPRRHHGALAFRGENSPLDAPDPAENSQSEIDNGENSPPDVLGTIAALSKMICRILASLPFSDKSHSLAENVGKATVSEICSEMADLPKANKHAADHATDFTPPIYKSRKLSGTGESVPRARGASLHNHDYVNGHQVRPARAEPNPAHVQHLPPHWVRPARPRSQRNLRS